MSWEEKKVGTGERVICATFLDRTSWFIERHLTFAFIFCSVTIAVITLV